MYQWFKKKNYSFIFFFFFFFFFPFELMINHEVMMNWSNRASIINHFFFNCALFRAERTELLTNLLTLGITNVNMSLLLIGCDDYDEVNKNIFKVVHHFIDSAGRL